MGLFDGITYDHDEDGDRLVTQLRRVFQAMRPGQWWTLGKLAVQVGGSEAGVSARLRDLRKPKFGGYIVERRRVPGGRGLWEYRLVTTSTEAVA